jgi:phosphatidylserine decarboxylase
MRPSVLLQYCLPHRLLSRVVYFATRWRFKPWKNFLIRQITQRYAVDLSEANEADINQYVHFNAFFTRSLKPTARAADADPHTLLQDLADDIAQHGSARAASCRPKARTTA